MITLGQEEFDKSNQMLITISCIVISHIGQFVIESYLGHGQSNQSDYINQIKTFSVITFHQLYLSNSFLASCVLVDVAG